MTRQVLFSFLFAIFALITVAFAQVAFGNTCEQYAIAQASKAHKSGTGPIRGQNNFRVSPELVSETDGLIKYVITISDNNKYQPKWEVNYLVSVYFDGQSCQKVSVRKSLIKVPKTAKVMRARVDDAVCGSFNPLIIGDACLIFLTKDDGVRLGVLFNLLSDNKVLACEYVAINTRAITPITNQAVVNELRSINPYYHYVYGTFFHELFEVIR